MKKRYIVPTLRTLNLDSVKIIATSIKSIGGNSGIGLGDGEVPTEANTKANFAGEEFDWD